jgi:hypothetical protein
VPAEDSIVVVAAAVGALRPVHRSTSPRAEWTSVGRSRLAAIRLRSSSRCARSFVMSALADCAFVLDDVAARGRADLRHWPDTGDDRSTRPAAEGWRT